MTSIVITGGPGSGKTTLIQTLKAEGCAVIEESGRAVIQRQMMIDGEGLPWRDRALFAELMLDREIEAHAHASAADGLVFQDRGMPDVVGYLGLCGLTPPPHLLRAAQTLRHARRVFIAPFWAEIFTQDAERRQDMAEAHRTFEAMARSYSNYGYELIELPFAPAADRAAFVLDQVRSET